MKAWGLRLRDVRTWSGPQDSSRTLGGEELGLAGLEFKGTFKSLFWAKKNFRPEQPKMKLQPATLNPDPKPSTSPNAPETKTGYMGSSLD